MKIRGIFNSVASSRHWLRNVEFSASQSIPLSVEGRLDLIPFAFFAERMASKERQAAEGVDKSV